MMGNSLRTKSQLGREMADQPGVSQIAFALVCGRVHSQGVVAAHPLWAGTYSLNRYPSPVGRIGLPLGRPPIFFVCLAMFCRVWRGFAQIRTRTLTGYLFAPIPAFWATSGWSVDRRHDTWFENSSPLRFLRVSAWPVVATPLLNRGSSVAVPGRPRRCWSMATSQPAPLRAPRRMSSIVNASRRGVDATGEKISFISPMRVAAPALSCAHKPCEKQRGIEHDYRKNPGRSRGSSGHCRVLRCARNVQSIPLQPGLRPADSSPLTRGPSGARVSHLPSRASGADRSFAAGAFLRSDTAKKRDSACSRRS